MNSSAEGFVPITRAFLSRYYDKHPFSPISADVQRLTTELRTLSGVLEKEFALTSGEKELVREADSPAPHKLDENMWRNREYIEEILFLLEKSQWPRLLQEYAEKAGTLEKLQETLKKSLENLEVFQSKNSAHVFNTVMTYMPQDFRGSLIRQQKERSERNRQAEVDALVSGGGSIRDRYELLWNQQMERRRQLAQLGSATGVYKTLVKYLVGVPQVLLDFVRQINDDDGPMEEQRERYGPPLYSLTKMSLSIRLFVSLSWGHFEARKLQEDEFVLLEQAVGLYASELERFLLFIGEVVGNAPFFISADEAGAAESRKINEYKEAIIPAGMTHEVSLVIESVNSYIAWDFSLVQGKMSMDIGFHVEYINPSGETMLILPYRRYQSDEGNFCTISTGCYKLIWDNSYSAFFKKNLRYKVDAIPPGVETPIPDPEAKDDN
ncbi:retinal-binding protein [Wolffia australiana]